LVTAGNRRLSPSTREASVQIVRISTLRKNQGAAMPKFELAAEAGEPDA
jgi:hypothetical protein